MEEQNFIDTLRLSESQLQDILDSLDINNAGDEDGPSSNRRSGADIRLPYRHRHIHLTIDHPGGGQSPFSVAGRNLTPRGLGFLHGNYLHSGTPGRVELPQTIGSDAAMRCTVIWCRHVRNHVHEAAVIFEHPIDLWRHIEGAEAGADLATRIDPKELKGRVLVLSEDDLMREMIVHELSETELHILSHSDLDEAIKNAQAEPPDVVLYDLEPDKENAATNVHKMREAPVFGSLLIATGEPNTQRIQPLKDAGADGVLRKPFQTMQLFAVLLEWLTVSQNQEEGASSTNIIAERDPTSRQLVDQYLTQLKSLNEDLATAMGADDFVQVRALSRRIYESAGVFGLMPLSRNAKIALTQLDSCYSIEESTTQIQKMLQMSRKAILDAANAEGAQAA